MEPLTTNEMRELFGLEPTPEPDDPPVIVEVVYLPGTTGDSPSWCVPACPYCGHWHIHGAAPDEIAKRELGHVWSHCAGAHQYDPQNRGYQLVNSGLVGEWGRSGRPMIAGATLPRPRQRGARKRPRR